MVKLKFQLWAKALEQIPVTLQETLVLQKVGDVGLVPRELVVVVLNPGEKRRVVRMLDAQG